MPRQKQKQSQKVIVNIHKPKRQTGRKRVGVSSKTVHPIVVQSHHHHQIPHIGYAENMGIRNNHLEDTKLQGTYHMVMGLAEREKANQENMAKLIKSNNLLVAKYNADREKMKEDKLKSMRQTGGGVKVISPRDVMEEMKRRKTHGNSTDSDEEEPTHYSSTSIFPSRRFDTIGYSETTPMDPTQIQSNGGFDMRGYRTA